MLIKYRSLMVFFNLDSGETLTKHIFFMKLLSTVQYCKENIAIFNLKDCLFKKLHGHNWVLKKEIDLCPLITPKKIF